MSIEANQFVDWQILLGSHKPRFVYSCIVPVFRCTSISWTLIGRKVSHTFWFPQCRCLWTITVQSIRDFQTVFCQMCIFTNCTRHLQSFVSSVWEGLISFIQLHLSHILLRHIKWTTYHLLYCGWIQYTFYELVQCTSQQVANWYLPVQIQHG